MRTSLGHLFYPSLMRGASQTLPPNMIGRSRARCPLCTMEAMVAFRLSASPVVRTPPQYRPGAPVPADQIVVAAFAFAGLLAFGIILAWLWNRWNAREPHSVENNPR